METYNDFQFKMFELSSAAVQAKGEGPEQLRQRLTSGVAAPVSVKEAPAASSQPPGNVSSAHCQQHGRGDAHLGGWPWT